MILGIVFVVSAVLCHMVAARGVTHENDELPLPTVYSVNLVRPSRRTRRFQTAGWILSIMGALRVGESFWMLTPGWSAVTVIALLLLINAIPALVITLAHNRDHGLQH
ncbi:hypothetical protein QMK17_24250 [Rhodococcus sp. G-MC3]|uniref:hypothetical protein n=1 Tax=Rhodococcus sp. G-MC3 TaxID=3046209 RepID=UPI0024BA9F29|nr:hypothetical protein [Rhodococcus sp. G-MC3]MDJ0396421.1 hypothetical protein [Rhodococcus sp. G-MC3]